MSFRSKAIRLAMAGAVISSLASAAQAGSANVEASASGEFQVAQQTYLDVMANLEAAGYTIVETKRTLLGRVKIMARNSAHMREIVVSRATGEVKRDEIVEVFLVLGTGRDGEEGGTASSEASTGSSTATGTIGATVGATADVSSGSGGLGSLSGTVSGAIGASGSGSAGGGAGSAAGEASGGLSGGLGLGN